MDWHTIGLGVSALSMFGRYRLPSIPKPLATAGIAVGAGVLVMGIISASWMIIVPGIGVCALLAGTIDWKYNGWVIRKNAVSITSEKASIDAANNQARIAEQRAVLLQQLTQQYLMDNDANSSRIMAGLELPPVDFLNRELERRRASWRVHSTDGPTANIEEI